MPVGAEDDLLVRGQLADDRLGARRGDDDVAERLHRGRAVDVGQRDMIGMLRPEARELFGRATVLEAAPRVHVGQHDDLFGRQYLRRLDHELDAAEGDDLGIRSEEHTSELQSLMRISYAVFCLKKKKNK